MGVFVVVSWTGVADVPHHGYGSERLALCSFNLLFLFQANYSLLFTYGAMAASDGGLLQFIELPAWGYLALACFIVVETCREGLLSRIRYARR